MTTIVTLASCVPALNLTRTDRGLDTKAFAPKKCASACALHHYDRRRALILPTAQSDKEDRTVNRTTGTPRLVRATSPADREQADAPLPLQPSDSSISCRRRSALSFTGAVLAAQLASGPVNPQPAAASPGEDFLLFEGGSGKLSPISCTAPKDPTRAAPRGSAVTTPNNYEFVDPCPLGGVTLETPWSFWGPSALQPLTGFQVGDLDISKGAVKQGGKLGLGPDPSGTLDARFESEYGIVLVSAVPDRRNDPWVGKGTLEDAGSLQEVLDALNPQLGRNLVSSSAETVQLPEDSDPRGTTYYTYEFNNTATKFANRRIIKMGIAGGKLVLFDARCNEAQWAAAEDVLKPMVASFRFGTVPASKPS